MKVLPILLSLSGSALAAAPYCLAGQKCFPSAATLATFNSTVGGRLTTAPPYGSVCYQGTFDQDACATLVENKTSFAFRATIPEAMMFTDTEFDENGNGCPVPATVPTSPLTGKCVLGALASYIVEVESAQDISLAIKFAAKYNLRLRVKNVKLRLFSLHT